LPVGFFAIAQKYSDAAAAGTVLAPAKTVAEMQRVAFNNYLCGAITVMFVLLAGDRWRCSRFGCR
jgi:hypothetical protein